MSDFSEIISNVAFYSISATQLLPVQTSFPTSVLMPDWTYYTDYPTLTSDLKEEFRTSSEWSHWQHLVYLTTRPFQLLCVSVSSSLKWELE